MCESVSHITSPLVKLFTVSRQASTADGDQCGQGVLWWLVWECEPAPGARCVARRGGGREGVIPLTYSSLQFYNILHHPELFPCIRVLGDGVSNWWREHKQDTGHLYHSAPACVTPRSIAFKCGCCGKVFNIENDHTQERGHLHHSCVAPQLIALTHFLASAKDVKKRFNAEEKLVQQRRRWTLH